MNNPIDWSGEAGNPPEDFVASEHVRLPVGIRKEGTVYRDVYIDEMCGIDDHLIASKEAQNNGAIATSLVLMRCIQEIDGLLERKKNTEKKFDRALVRKMTQVDRDYLLSRIYMLGGSNDVVMAGKCPRCGSVWEETAFLSQLKVIEWPDDKELELPFELIRGVYDNSDGVGVYHKEGTIRFPTGADSELIGKLGNSAEMVDSTIAACVTKIGTLDHIDTEMAKRMKTRDRQKLMVTIQQDLPGLRQWKTVKCDCNREFEIVCDLTAFFDERRRQTKG